MTVYFTPLDYDSPLPGATTDPRRPDQYKSTVDYNAKRIYQWHHKDLISISAGNPLYDFQVNYPGLSSHTTMYESAELVIFDLDTLQEISRVEPDFSWFLSERTDTDASADFAAMGTPDANTLRHLCFRTAPAELLPDWIGKTIAIPGTNWVVTGVSCWASVPGSGTYRVTSPPNVPFYTSTRKYLVVNATTGSMNITHVPFIWVSTPHAAFINPPPFPGVNYDLPNINATAVDDQCRPLCAASVSGTKSVIISKDECFIADGFFLRSQLIDNSSGALSFVDTEPTLTVPNPSTALITWANFYGICIGSSGSGADFYMLVDMVGSDGKTLKVIKVVSDTIGLLSSSVLATITESDFVTGISINYVSGYVFVNYLAGSAVKIKKIDASTGSVSLSSTTTGNGTGITLPIAYGDFRTSAYPGFSQLPTEGNYLLGTSGNEDAGFENRYYKVDLATLAETEWPTFIGEQAGLDTLDSSGLVPYGFFDDARDGIFYPQDFRIGFNSNEWVFVSTNPGGGGGGGDSDAIITGSMGQFTGVFRAMGEQPCPIVGSTSYGICLTGRASFSAGIGQVLSGRDNVLLACDTSSSGTALAVATPQQVGWLVNQISAQPWLKRKPLSVASMASVATRAF